MRPNGDKPTDSLYINNLKFPKYSTRFIQIDQKIFYQLHLLITSHIYFISPKLSPS